MTSKRQLMVGVALAALLGLAQAATPAEQFLASMAGSSKPEPQWMKYTDAMTGSGQSDGTIVRKSENGSAYMHVQGQLKTGFMFPFMGFQTQAPGFGTVMDWSGRKGVRFLARGDGKVYRLNILLKTVRDHDEFGAEFIASKEWKVCDIPFSKLQQLGFGRRAKWNPQAVSGVGLHISGGVMPFSFDVRNIELY